MPRAYIVWWSELDVLMQRSKWKRAGIIKASWDGAVHWNRAVGRVGPGGNWVSAIMSRCWRAFGGSVRRTDVVLPWECSTEGLARWHSLDAKYSATFDPLLSVRSTVMHGNGDKLPIGITRLRGKRDQKTHQHLLEISVCWKGHEINDYLLIISLSWRQKRKLR